MKVHSVQTQEEGIFMIKERFRFRVYLEAENRMLYSEEWQDFSWPQIAKWAQEGLLMQVIGLKDIKGDDIFEGDIVEVYNTYKEEIFCGSVHYHNGAYVIRKDDHTSHGRFINYEIKVIGNVFETPKLLNQR